MSAYIDTGECEFKKIWDPLQNYRRQKCDRKRVLHREPTNINRHDTKVGRPDDLVSGNGASLSIPV